MVVDGTFIEAKEVIGGYAELEVADLDEALEIAKTWPGRTSVEVRPSWKTEGADEHTRNHRGTQLEREAIGPRSSCSTTYCFGSQTRR
jgi:hypothetical protein